MMAAGPFWIGLLIATGPSAWTKPESVRSRTDRDHGICGSRRQTSGRCVAEASLVSENRAKAGQPGLDRVGKIFTAHLVRLLNDVLNFGRGGFLELRLRIHGRVFRFDCAPLLDPKVWAYRQIPNHSRYAVIAWRTIQIKGGLTSRGHRFSFKKIWHCQRPLLVSRACFLRSESSGRTLKIGLTLPPE